MAYCSPLVRSAGPRYWRPPALEALQHNEQCAAPLTGASITAPILDPAGALPRCPSRLPTGRLRPHRLGCGQKPSQTGQILCLGSAQVCRGVFAECSRIPVEEDCVEFRTSLFPRQFESRSLWLARQLDRMQSHSQSLPPWSAADACDTARFQGSTKRRSRRSSLVFTTSVPTRQNCKQSTGH